MEVKKAKTSQYAHESILGFGDTQEPAERAGRTGASEHALRGNAVTLPDSMAL